MNYDDLSDELKAKVGEAKSANELLALAAQEGIELSDEQLEMVSGGVEWSGSGSGSNCSSQFMHG